MGVVRLRVPDPARSQRAAFVQRLSLLGDVRCGDRHPLMSGGWARLQTLGSRVSRRPQHCGSTPSSTFDRGYQLQLRCSATTGLTPWGALLRDSLNEICSHGTVSCRCWVRSGRSRSSRTERSGCASDPDSDQRRIWTVTMPLNRCHSPRRGSRTSTKQCVRRFRHPPTTNGRIRHSTDRRQLRRFRTKQCRRTELTRAFIN